MKKLFLVASIAGLMNLTACSTIDPYTNEAKYSNAAKGAGIGAVGGALAGIASGNKNGALHGALIGAASGGGIGYYMDRQEAKLRQQLQGSGVSVTREGDIITLNMPGNITFDTNASQVKPGMRQTLDAVAIVLQEFSKTRVKVGGHTDSTGQASYNQLLSEARANSVAGVLADNGVNWSRLIITGHGQSRPVASNATAAGRAQNRRVEITLQAS